MKRETLRQTQVRRLNHLRQRGRHRGRPLLEVAVDDDVEVERLERFDRGNPGRDRPAIERCRQA
jgi:hypothetical protein